MQSRKRFAITKLPLVVKRKISEHLNPKYLLVLLSCGTNLAELALEMMSIHTKCIFTIKPIYHRRKVSFHLEIPFRHGTLLWNFYLNHDVLPGKEMTLNLGGISVKTFDGLDDDGRSCFNSIISGSCEDVKILIKCLLEILGRNLTDVIFIGTSGKSTPEILEWDLIVAADNLKIGQTPSVGNTVKLINSREALGKQTHLEKAHFNEKMIIRDKSLLFLQAEILQIKKNSYDVKDLYEPIRNRISCQDHRYHMLGVTLNLSGQDQHELQTRFNLIPVPDIVFDTHLPAASIWFVPVRTPKVQVAIIKETQAQEFIWVFYFTRRNSRIVMFDMVLWKRKEQVINQLLAQDDNDDE